MTSSIHTIKKIFELEFGLISDRFAIVLLSPEEARSSKSELVYRPGVYVWISGSEVVKVGRHLTNARKRALEHIRDDTAGKMRSLSESDSTRLLLLTTKEEDSHWVAAVEIFLEKVLEPTIRSKRTG